LINRYTFHARGWAKPQKARYRTFIANSLRIAQEQPSARAIHSEPESHPHAARAWGKGIVEGFT
jgi:hypothetical protein